MPPRRQPKSGKQPAASRKQAREADAGPGAAQQQPPPPPEQAGAGHTEVLQVFVLDMEEQADAGAGTIALYGCTADRRSVMLTVQEFRYHFTISADQDGAISEAGLRSDVDHNVRERLPATMKGFAMEVVMRRSLVGYRSDVTVPMLRVYPPAVRGATNRIAQAFIAELGARVYETQLDATTRFSLDSGIRCGNWLEVALPAGASSCTAAEVIVIDDEEEDEAESHRGRSGKARAPHQPHATKQHSHCDVELVAEWDASARRLTTCGGVVVQVHAFSKSSHWGSLSPLRTLCLSIDRYPTPVPAREWADTGECPDPVRAISVITTIENGSPGTDSKRRLVLLNAEGLPQFEAGGAGGPSFGPFATRVYASEKVLLMAFQELVLAENPSLLTGFEVGEALRVLLARAEALKLRDFGYFARRRGVKVVVKVMQMYSARWAKTKTRMSGTSNQEGTEVICPGRVVLDLMRVTQMQDALRLYTLGEISIALLGKTFETIDMRQTEALLRGDVDEADGDGRVAAARALRAFLSTADLAMEVLARRNAVAELVEVSRVTGQQFQQVYIRGQISRVSSLLQTHCHALDVVIPASTDDLLDKQPLNRSAFLIDPSPPSADNPEAIGTAGLRQAFTAVLDFKSLYPSIMIEHNICYSTLVKGPANQVVGSGSSGGDDAVFESPIGARFVGKGAREGVLPRLLLDLLEARGEAQRELRQRVDLTEGQRHVLDARQRAFKLAANAVYGFTGANVNVLYSRELGDSILALGREYLTRLIRTVKEAFPELTVIYGDTDSVFVEYPQDWGREAVTQHSVEVLTPALNARLPERVRVKHEKVLGPILLQHIRRYAAFEWLPDGSRRLEMKGIEAVQRNTMPFIVRTMESTILKILNTPPAEAGEWAAVKEHVREQVEALMTSKIDIFGLTLTRGLWRLGEYDSKQPHVHLIEKIEAADPRRSFRVGERVGYVLVQREADAPLYKKAEEPFVALQEQLQLDLPECLKQLRMPMVRLLQLIMPEASAEQLFQVHFKALQVGAKTSSPGAITKFFGRATQLQCLRCRATVASPSRARVGAGAGSQPPPLCDKCRAAPEFGLLSVQLAEKEAAAAFTSAWAQCAACQRGGRHLPVLCTNASCPVSFKRVKAEREGVEARRKLAEFEEALF